MKFHTVILCCFFSWINFSVAMEASKLAGTLNAAKSRKFVLGTLRGRDSCENGEYSSNVPQVLRVYYDCDEPSKSDKMCRFNEIIVKNGSQHITDRYIVDHELGEFTLTLNASSDRELHVEFQRNGPFPSGCSLEYLEPLEVARQGAQCEVNDQCSLNDKLTECRDGRCQCKRGYCRVYDMCVPCYELGDPCTYPESPFNGYCRVANSYCKTGDVGLNGTCSCISTYVQIGSNCWPSMNNIQDNYEMAAKIAIASAVVVALVILLAVLWNTIKNRLPDMATRRSGHNHPNRRSIDSIDRFVQNRLRNRPPAYSPDMDKPPSYEESVTDSTDLGSSSTSSPAPAEDNRRSPVIDALEEPTSPPPAYVRTPAAGPDYERSVSYENRAFVFEDNAIRGDVYLRLASISNSVDNTPPPTPVHEQSDHFSTYL